MFKRARTRQTINAMEDDKHDPSLLLVYSLAAYLQLPVEELFIFSASGGRTVHQSVSHGPEVRWELMRVRKPDFARCLGFKLTVASRLTSASRHCSAVPASGKQPVTKSRKLPSRFLPFGAHL